MMVNRKVIGWAFCGLILAACAGVPPTSPADSEPVAEESGVQAPVLPETPAGEKLAWLLEKLNAETIALTAEEADEYFSADFLVALPHARLLAVFEQVAASYLAQAVHEGLMSWEDELAIDDAHKSLPSGVMQNEAAGTLFTLGTYADQMISISDNTATDHLIAHLGRERVENSVEQSGHHAPCDAPPQLTQWATAGLGLHRG